MAERYEGLDISKYQGVLNQDIVNAMVAEGIKFVYVRFSQGLSYKDGQAENNTKLLQAAGILVGPYHFTTADNATGQYTNFVAAMKDFQFDLPPALDCEAYTALAGRYLDLRPNDVPFETYSLSPKSLKARHLEQARETHSKFAVTLLSLIPSMVYGYSYTTSSIAWSIANQLEKGWLKTQTKLQESFPIPAIYTNASSGNTIFGTNTAFARYPLWVANWTTNPVPFLPKAWTGKPFFIWQNGVIDGSPYKVAGQIDHNFWGDLCEFPGNVTPPPPPPPDPDGPEKFFDVEMVGESGNKWSGRVNLVEE